MSSPIEVVCFDWGDTLMRVFPEQAGPMADWPEVEAMAGADSALRALQGRYRLAVLTTGGESSEEQIRRALRRVGLEIYFERFILSREMGLAKSDPEFYRAAVTILGCQAPAAVMVGDNYENDIAPAKQAGLRAIWYLRQPRAADGVAVPPALPSAAAEAPPEAAPRAADETAGAATQVAPGRPVPDATLRDLSRLPEVLDRLERD